MTLGELNKTGYIAYDVRTRQSFVRPHKAVNEAANASEHQRIVAKALAEGKPVPPEVLRDYPDLARAAPERAVAPPTERPIEPARPPAAEVPVEPPAAPPRGPGGPTTIGPEDADEAIARFGRFLTSPETESAWDLTLQLRKETLAQRAARLQARAAQLIIEGKGTEEAIRQAMQETMTGALPGAKTGIAADLTEVFRDALFSKVYQVLQSEPFELMSTQEALRNALLGRAIPRIPGTAEGSAYSRLLRVFGDNPEIMRALEQGKPLQDTVAEAVLGSAPPPTGIDQAVAAYLRELPTIPSGQARLGEAAFEFAPEMPLAPPLQRAESIIEMARVNYPDIGRLPLSERRALLQQLEATGVTQDELGRLQLELFAGVTPQTILPYAGPIAAAVKQPSLMPLESQHFIIQSLKEAGWTVVDIGNFLRANKASVDFSFWRQQLPLIMNHKVDFAVANAKAWKALWSPSAAKRSWQDILKDPLYRLYEDMGLDFLRPLELPPGQAAYRGVEEFGFTNIDRAIPRFTGKLPHINISQRAFVTGANEHNWRIFKDFYRQQLKVNERIAQGKIVLKEGQGFSIQNNMRDFGKLLQDFSGRASLGKARELAPALGGLIFAPRYALGRLISPRHLFSGNKFVRQEAWKDAAATIGFFGSLLMVGKELGFWDVEVNPTSSDFAKIRIGKTRVDPWGGYQQFVRFFAQVIANSGISTQTGQPYKKDPLQAITRFLRGKASPLAGLISDFKTGKTYVGEKVNLTSPKQWIERVSPLLPWDMYEAIKEFGPLGALLGPPGAVGAGVSTYGVPNWQGDMQPYFDIPPDETDRKAQLRAAKSSGERSQYALSREDYRKRHPDVEAKLFIVGAISSLQSRRAASEVRALMQEHKIDPQNISGLQARIQQQAEAQERGARLRQTNVDILIRLLEAAPASRPSAPSPAPRQPAAAPTPGRTYEPGSMLERARREMEAEGVR
jgi:hypothetical protein